MSTTLCIPVVLGPSKAGLTLAAHLTDVDGANTGDEITVGFTEIGEGQYHWKYAFADDFQGGVKFYEQGQAQTILAYTAINPADLGAAADLGTLNIDTTGGTLTLAKALEVIVARCMGNLAYNATTGVVTFFGRDGATIIATVKLTGLGNRSESNIP